MIEKKTHVDVIYTKFKDSAPVIRERIQTMGTFMFGSDLSVEIAAKDPGADIQKVTWDRDKRSGEVRYKNKDIHNFTGGTVKADKDDTIIKLNISENETLECKVVGNPDFDLSEFYDKENAVRIEYYRETDDATILNIISGTYDMSKDNDVLTVKIDTDDQDSEIKSIVWTRTSEKKSGSVAFSDSKIKAFESSQLYIDESYTGPYSKSVFMFVDDEETLILARFLTDLPEINEFYDAMPEYLK